MAGRSHWVVRSGVGAVTAALLMAGLSTTALGGERSARTVAHRFDGPASAGVPTPGDTAAGTDPARTTAAAVGLARAAAADPASAGGAASGDALPPMGAFTTSGADGVRNIAAFQDWLGGTVLRVGHTYLPGDSWQDIEDAPGMLKPWADWTRAEAGRMLVVNVPMQARNEEHLSDGQVRDLIRAGADGAFDQHFTRLARHLVGIGAPAAVIVLGWEMNGTTYTHRCGPDPANWKVYWNRVVTAMRSVPGQRFTFDFAPSRGRDAVPWTECYPGDKAVDVIGMDSYDQPGDESFHEQVTEPYGLQAQVDFAARHHKAISYPEWGLFRNGDDADYMSLMLSWIIAHKPLYQTITDYCPHGVWQCGENPRSSAVYQALLSGRPTAPAPTLPPTTSSAVPDPASGPDGSDRSCSPMLLSAGLKQLYDSGEVCVTLHRKAGATAPSGTSGAAGTGTASAGDAGSTSGTGGGATAGAGAPTPASNVDGGSAAAGTTAGEKAATGAGTAVHQGAGSGVDTASTPVAGAATASD